MVNVNLQIYFRIDYIQPDLDDLQTLMAQLTDNIPYITNHSLVFSRSTWQCFDWHHNASVSKGCVVCVICNFV